jgi:hypothetical protein
MKYRKKPVVIEARQLTEETIIDIIGWITEHQSLEVAINSETDIVNGLFIETLEGTMLASFGDFIIRGVNGEFYPCKPDIFEKTYELAE